MWEVASSLSAMPGTGPAGDHTLVSGTGRFLLMTSYGSLAGALAALTSVAIVSDGRCSLQFWYCLYGADVGTMYVGINAFSNVSKVVWTAAGSVAGWRFANVTLPRVDGAASVSIVAASTGRVLGNVALDDVSLVGCGGGARTRVCVCVCVCVRRGVGRAHVTAARRAPRPRRAR